MFQWLKDLLAIYKLKDLWLIVAVPTTITLVWGLLCFLLSIHNDIIRAVAIWTLFLILTVLASAAGHSSWREGVERYT